MASRVLFRRRIKNVSKGPVRVDAKKALAKGDKYGDMKNRVRSQLMQLNPVNKQETTKKLVDGSRKTMDKKFGKHYPKSCGWRRSSFITGRCHLVAVEEETQFLQILMLNIIELRSPPSRDLLRCWCRSGVGG